MDSQAKYAVVARGEADIYLRLPTRADYREKIWDHAAGALIVEEAGGVVTDITGRPLEFNHGRELAANRGVIVTNGRLHAQVIEAVRAIGNRAGVKQGRPSVARSPLDGARATIEAERENVRVLALVGATKHDGRGIGSPGRSFSVDSGLSTSRRLARWPSSSTGLIGSRGILPAAEFLDRTGPCSRTAHRGVLAVADDLLA